MNASGFAVRADGSLSQPPATSPAVRLYLPAFSPDSGHVYFPTDGAPQSAKAGKNSLKFSGRIGSKKLKPGTYRVSAVAVDQAGRSSKEKLFQFKILRR